MSASAADHETPSPTLFMDRAGSVHRSLDGSIMEAKRSRSPNVHAPLMDNSLAVPGALDYPGSNRYKLLHFGRGYRPSSICRHTLPSRYHAEMRNHSRTSPAVSKGLLKGMSTLCPALCLRFDSTNCCVAEAFRHPSAALLLQAGSWSRSVLLRLAKMRTHTWEVRLQPARGPPKAGQRRAATCALLAAVLSAMQPSQSHCVCRSLRKALTLVCCSQESRDEGSQPRGAPGS